MTSSKGNLYAGVSPDNMPTANAPTSYTDFKKFVSPNDETALLTNSVVEGLGIVAQIEVELIVRLSSRDYTMSSALFLEDLAWLIDLLVEYEVWPCTGECATWRVVARRLADMGREIRADASDLSTLIVLPKPSDVQGAWSDRIWFVRRLNQLERIAFIMYGQVRAEAGDRHRSETGEYLTVGEKVKLVFRFVDLVHKYRVWPWGLDMQYWKEVRTLLYTLFKQLGEGIVAGDLGGAEDNYPDYLHIPD